MSCYRKVLWWDTDKYQNAFRKENSEWGSLFLLTITNSSQECDVIALNVKSINKKTN